MSDGNPPDDMFGGLPFKADLMKLLQGQTSGSNDICISKHNVLRC